MAAIFILAGVAVADRIEKKKEKRRAKRAHDDTRYRQLERETEGRLRRESVVGGSEGGGDVEGAGAKGDDAWWEVGGGTEGREGVEEEVARGSGSGSESGSENGRGGREGLERSVTAGSVAKSAKSGKSWRSGRSGKKGSSEMQQERPYVPFWQRPGSTV